MGDPFEVAQGPSVLVSSGVAAPAVPLPRGPCERCRSWMGFEYIELDTHRNLHRSRFACAPCLKVIFGQDVLYDMGSASAKRSSGPEDGPTEPRRRPWWYRVLAWMASW